MAKQATEPKSRLRFDLPALKPGEQVVSRFPELANYPAFVEHGSDTNDWAARFAIYYSDYGSEYRDLSIDLKRDRCLAAAGVKTDHPRRADVLAGRDTGVLALIIEYVRLQDWLEYATLFHGREYAWRLIASLSVPDDLVLNEKDKEKPKTKKDKSSSLTFALATVGELDRRWNALWMADPEVKATAQQQNQRDKLTSETRAEGRSFVPKKP